MAELPDELRNRAPRPAGQKPSATLTLDAYLRLREELRRTNMPGETRRSARAIAGWLESAKGSADEFAASSNRHCPDEPR